jgi:hypothetical protein
MIPPPSPAEPTRVGIALLTLQLRASLQDAAAADAVGAGIQPADAVAELRARIAPLLQAHRKSLDEALERERAQAAAAVSAAHREASAIVAAASTASAGDEAMDTTPLAVAAYQAELPVEDVVSVGWNTSDPSVAELSRRAAPELPPINVVIDPEALARAFATVVAKVLDERGAWPSAAFASSQVSPPASVKPSLWTQARHPDVLLLGFATLIVLVILVAWLA